MPPICLLLARLTGCVQCSNTHPIRRLIDRTCALAEPQELDGAIVEALHSV